MLPCNVDAWSIYYGNFDGEADSEADGAFTFSVEADVDQKLEEIFREVFRLQESDDVTRIRQVNHPAWDSLAHVTMISAIESEFGVTVEIANSIELTSFEAVALYLSEHIP